MRRREGVELQRKLSRFHAACWWYIKDPFPFLFAYLYSVLFSDNNFLSCVCVTPLLERKEESKGVERMAKKSRAAGGKRKGGRKPKRSFAVFIHRTLKQVNKGLTLSSRTMRVLNSFVNDMFDRVASEAANLARVNKRRTLGSREVQTAVRLVLPAELAKHAMAEGTKAVAKASA